MSVARIMRVGALLGAVVFASAAWAGGPPQAMQAPGLSSAMIGAPNGVAGLDGHGGLTSVPVSGAPGTSDASVRNVSNLMITRYMGLTNNEFTASLQGAIPVINSNNVSYEKAVLYVRVNQSDPSDNVNGYLKDGVGIESQANTTIGNLAARIWAYDSITNVVAGSDGYASGMELTVSNNGTDQPAIGTTTTKNGVHLVGSGSFGGTSAVQIDGNWHHGVSCPQTSVSIDCLYVTNGTNTLAQITPTGTGLFTAFGAVGGGLSTATFANNCFSETGTPYLGGCLFGANNNISTQYSVVGGNAAADDSEYGSAHFASANFGHGAGDAQFGWRTLSGTIASGGGTVRLTTQSGVYSSSTTIPIPFNHGISLDCKMVAHLYNGQDSANFSLDDALFDSGTTAGSTRLIGGAWASKSASSGASGKLTASVSADTALGSVNISVTATSGGPWDITARCFSVEAR